MELLSSVVYNLNWSRMWGRLTTSWTSSGLSETSWSVMSTLYRSTTFSSGWICLFVTQQYKHHRAISMAGIRPGRSANLVLFTVSLHPVYNVLLLGIVKYYAFILQFSFTLSRQCISVEFKHNHSVCVDQWMSIYNLIVHKITINLEDGDSVVAVVSYKSATVQNFPISTPLYVVHVRQDYSISETQSFQKSGNRRSQET